MTVSARIFLILFIALVQGSPTPNGGNGSGHRRQSPIENRLPYPPHTPLESVVLPPIGELVVDLRDFDHSLDAVVLRPGSVYGVPPGPIDTPIPKEGYYHVPSMVVIATTPRSTHYVLLKRTRVVRLDDARIRRIPHVRECPNIYHGNLYSEAPWFHIEEGLENDKHLKAILLPRRSTYRTLGHDIETLIPTRGYSCLPAGAFVTTPQGIIAIPSSGRVARISPNADLNVLPISERVSIASQTFIKLYCKGEYHNRLRAYAQQGESQRRRIQEGGVENLDDYVLRCQDMNTENLLASGVAGVDYRAPPIILYY